jgi:DNA repair ATPase RecN
MAKENDWDQSLLAFRSSAQTGVFSEEVTEHLAEYQAWSTQHQAALHKVEKSKALLDKLMAGPPQVGNLCTSALLGVKQGVSSLVYDIKSLSDQVSTNVKTLESETRNLNNTMAAFNKVDHDFSQGMHDCTEKRKQASSDLSAYQAQLKELKQVAPFSQFTHTGKVEWPPVAPSLLQDGWSKEHCLAFLDFTQKHTEHLPQVANVSDCDSDLEQPHKACSALYISIRASYQKAKEFLEDKTCEQAAKKKKNEQMVPLVSQRRQQVTHIKYSSEKLDALQPVLLNLNHRVDTLDAHVTESVHPHCAESEAVVVPETLSDIRGAIHSLQESPSHNDVVDKLPEDHEAHHVAYTVCAGDGDCETEGHIQLDTVKDATSNISSVAHVQAIMSWGGELQ